MASLQRTILRHASLTFMDGDLDEDGRLSWSEFWDFVVPDNLKPKLVEADVRRGFESTTGATPGEAPGSITFARFCLNMLRCVSVHTGVPVPSFFAKFDPGNKGLDLLEFANALDSFGFGS